jgi:Tfp pilus assembly protein PilN
VSQVNLLPPEILKGQQTRKLTVLVIAGGLVLWALIFLFYLLQAGSLGGVEDEIAAEQASNAQIQSEIDGLQHFEDLQVRAQAKQAQLAGAYAGEVSFSQMLMDVSRVIPAEAYLQTLAIQVNTVGGTTDTSASAPATGFVGTIQAGGQGLGVDSLSSWLTTLEQVKGWVNPWMGSITREEGTQVFTFTSQIDLTPSVLTRRGRQAVTPVA